ncbi:F-box only protein 33 isoform X2 [Anolis sagrei]|uniref:F-box only protein 33 isoform X2 n=1 Tax=Anolis sagrei TaxID=38937 RepID=UPI0035204AD1
MVRPSLLPSLRPSPPAAGRVGWLGQAGIRARSLLLLSPPSSSSSSLGALSLMLLFLSQEPEGRPGPGSGRRRRRPVAPPAAAPPARATTMMSSPVGAGSLPSELVVHIFSFLAAPDRLRASAACSHWRECLFYPALWPRLRLSLRVCPAERPRLDFLMRKCGWFVRELRVQFAADNYPTGGGGAGGGPEEGLEADADSAAGVVPASGPEGGGGGGGEAPLCPRWLELLRTYLELVLCVLSSVRNNRNLQKLSLFGDISILQQHGSISNTYLSKVDPDGKKIKQIQQLFEEILGNSRQLKWLSCGFMLQIVTPTSLSSLSNPIANTMEHLSLLDNHIPGNTTLITAIELERFVNLRSLALDFCDFTAEMARVLSDSNHVPLYRLSLLVHNISVMHKSLENMPEDEDWKALIRNSTNLRVYIMAFDIKSDDMLRILKPSIPLERIHFDSYITCVSGAVVDLISRQYDKFLTHFILMNDVIDMSGFPDLSDNRTEDPLVLLAWRCTRLSLLAVHGTQLFPLHRLGSQPDCNCSSSWLRLESA